MELVNPVPRSRADSYSADLCVKTHLGDISRRSIVKPSRSDRRIKGLGERKSTKQMNLGLTSWQLIFDTVHQMRLADAL